MENIEEIELTPTQKKIAKTKAKINTIKAIEKLEKECSRLEKSLTLKRDKIEELANEL